VKHATIVAATLVGSYAVLWLTEYIWNLLFHAPKAIYDGTIFEIAQVGSQARDQIAAAGKLAEEQIQGRQAKIVELEGLLSARHPHDVHLEDRISEAFKKLNETEQGFIRWLLDSGRVSRGRIQGAGFRGIQEELNERASIDLITHEIERAANGTEIDSYHQINPSYLSALKNVLHPPPRSATSP
jgi:hypothetical protein